MQGKIESGQLCTVIPTIDHAIQIHPGEVVLCKVKGKQFLHLVKKIQGDRYLIGNNKGFDNGWTSRQQIYGKLTKVEK